MPKLVHIQRGLIKLTDTVIAVVDDLMRIDDDSGYILWDNSDRIGYG